MTTSSLDVSGTGILAGREIVFTDPRDSRVSHRFDATTVEWSYQAGDSEPHPEISGPDEYEAFDVAEGLVYAQSTVVLTCRIPR
jgi:hypothetical protein